MNVTGEAIVYGDNISTDQIYPGRYTYLLLSDEEMATHALEDLDPAFPTRDVKGAIVVAGENFGCGSAREQAVKCLKIKGVSAVVAKSISRIYYRNCINEGLLPIVCPEAVDSIQNGDMITLDLDESKLTVGGKSFTLPKYPPFVSDILLSGGLIASIRREVAARKAQ